MGALDPSHQLTLSWSLRSVPSAVVRPKAGPQPLGLSAPLKKLGQHSIIQVSFFICAPIVHEEDHLFFVDANARANFLGAQHCLRSLAPNCSLLQSCRQQVTYRQSQPSKHLRTDRQDSAPPDSHLAQDSNNLNYPAHPGVNLHF